MRQFRRWRFYAEEGLARQQVQVSFYSSMLKIEYQDTELSFYTEEQLRVPLQHRLASMFCQSTDETPNEWSRGDKRDHGP